MLPTSSTKLLLCKCCWSSSWSIRGLFRWLLHWTSIQGNICWSMEANALQMPPCLQGMSVESIVLAWCQFSQSFHKRRSNPTACRITASTAKYEASHALKSALKILNSYNHIAECRGWMWWQTRLIPAFERVRRLSLCEAIQEDRAIVLNLWVRTLSLLSSPLFFFDATIPRGGSLPPLPLPL